LSNKAKIALALGIVLVVAAALIYYFSSRKETPVVPEQSPTDSGDIFVPGTTKYPQSPETIESPQTSSTASVSPTSSAVTSPAARTPVSTVDENNIRTYTIDVTPAPNAGPYDWTRTVGEMTVIDISASEIAKKTPCELSGLNDSKGNVFEKMSCDMIDFIDQKIFTPLLSINCGLTAQIIQYDSGRKVRFEFKDGACLIIDRE